MLSRNVGGLSICPRELQGISRELGKTWNSEDYSKCPDEDAMLDLQKRARKLGLVACSIVDAGRTQVEPGSRTVLAIGPGPKDIVDTLTGGLKLY